MMKAWLVRKKDEFCAEVVFAETRGKAKVLALATDCCEDARFIDIEIRRQPQVDKSYIINYIGRIKMKENLIHYKPTPEQLHKFRIIKALSEEEKEKRCVAVDDCTNCYMAIHQHLLSCTKHTCVQCMSEKDFITAMDNADCCF